MLSQCSSNNIQDSVLFRKQIIQRGGDWSSFALQHDAKSYSIDDCQLPGTCKFEEAITVSNTGPDN
jgi:hypothetical protein